MALLLGLIPQTAHADHHGMTMESDPGSPSSIGAGLSVLAASYSTTDYIGDYQGVVPALSWSDRRFAVAGSLALYRLQKNGRAYFGPGDMVLHGQATLVMRDAVRGGVMVMVSLPTGDPLVGFGMGHVMAMPALWMAWTVERITLSASAGCGRALAGAMTHDHGAGPIVEPMNLSELTWSAGGDLALTREVHVGVRMSGGVPVIDPGHHRVVAAVRVGWGSGRVDTAAELQAGLAGDPFNFRGVVETALHF